MRRILSIILLTLAAWFLTSCAATNNPPLSGKTSYLASPTPPPTIEVPPAGKFLKQFDQIAVLEAEIIATQQERVRLKQEMARHQSFVFWCGNDMINFLDELIEQEQKLLQTESGSAEWPKAKGVIAEIEEVLEGAAAAVKALEPLHRAEFKLAQLEGELSQQLIKLKAKQD